MRRGKKKERTSIAKPQNPAFFHQEVDRRFEDFPFHSSRVDFPNKLSDHCACTIPRYQNVRPPALRGRLFPAAIKRPSLNLAGTDFKTRHTPTHICHRLQANNGRLRKRSATLLAMSFSRVLYTQRRVSRGSTRPLKTGTGVFWLRRRSFGVFDGIPFIVFFAFLRKPGRVGVGTRVAAAREQQQFMSSATGGKGHASLTCQHIYLRRYEATSAQRTVARGHIKPSIHSKSTNNKEAKLGVGSCYFTSETNRSHRDFLATRKKHQIGGVLWENGHRR